MRHYAKPPLPFNGNKRNQLKNTERALNDMRELGYITDSTIFYDVFGGSGLLSHFIKHKYPQNRVIWNDFDDYPHPAREGESPARVLPSGAKPQRTPKAAASAQARRNKSSSRKTN